ncbi:MAG: hypothetical protein WDW38_009984 [Sanguina aurantia]
METLGSGSFIKEYEQLSALIQCSEDENASRDQVSKPSSTPASIGPKDLLDVTVARPKALKDPNQIWEDHEVTDAMDDDDVEDGREVPGYTFLYKQSVGTSETMLGMGDKDPSSNSCEDLVLRVELPGINSASEVDLDVKPTFVKLSSSKYKLSVYLPHTVDADRGKAQWDSSKHLLSLTLRIIRWHEQDGS